MDSDDAKLEKLITQCKNNGWTDVDVKVDALTKLQAAFESGIEVHDTDDLISALKACLRTSNQHLTTATLSAIPPLLPLLLSRSVHYGQSPSGSVSLTSSTSSVAPSGMVDVVTLRQLLMAFLPAGGVIERLGDKEKVQLKARETLVILGGYAFRAGTSSSLSTRSRDGKGVETPLMIFERFLREGGLASKVWKVKEQSILTLVHIRRAHHQFPIRPYLSLLVDSLEDTDAHVRDCARQSVVELFSGPAVTDAARADLKKELTKKSVRKTIVDGVLSKLLGGGSFSSGPPSRDGSENGDASMGTSGGGIARTVSQGNVREIPRPASRAAMAPSPTPITPTNESADIQSVFIASSKDLENEFAAMLKPFEGKETEHNWAARERGINRVRGMLKGDVHARYTETFLISLKEGFIQWSLKALASLRTTVSANTCSLYSEMAVALGPSLDPFCDIILTNLLKMAGFTKKIAAQQSQASVSAIITHTTTPPRVILPLLWQTLQEKTVQARAFVVGHLKHYLEVHGHRAKSTIESSTGLETLEKSLKKALADPSPAVRENARVLFWIFEEIWRNRGLVILEALDSAARKQLEKACPNPDLAAVLPITTPKNTKKTSVAAAIAASRAKAKAIATAPPTLRHQATSASHAAPVRQAASPTTSPRNSFTRPASPLRMSTSPPSTRSRVLSGPARVPGTPTAPPKHIRTPSGGSTRTASPSPPSPEQSTFRRRISSPLVAGGSPNRTSTIRKAMQTALPASPSSSDEHASPTPRRVDKHKPVALPRELTMFSDANGSNESLLLAQAVPIPDGDSDSDNDNSYPPVMPTSCFDSPTSNDSKPGISNALSSDSIANMGNSQVVVEDALRARAEQAESAAERLLELVEPEDEPRHEPIPALFAGNGNSTPKSKAKPAPIPIHRQVPPVTPVNRSAAILRQAAVFQDSPAQNGHSSSLMDILQGQKNETGWWLKRRTLVAQRTSKALEPSDCVEELQKCLVAFQRDEVDVNVLQKLALLCIENPVAANDSPPPSPGYDPSSPSPFITGSRSLPSVQSKMWDKDKSFERLFNGLILFMDHSRDGEAIEYGLIVVWEMLENQAPYLEGREADLFSVLLRVRYCNKLNVLEASNTIRDMLTSKIEPVYGLTTMHASLRAFYSEATPEFSDDSIKATTYAFGLIALGKFVLRLPAEIAEEELPRLKSTLITSLNDRSSLVVRESAAAAIIAAQLVLRDETHLFSLLDGLADEKKNLLTYLFDKHGVRGSSSTPAGPSGMESCKKK
ncbi:clasp N terminal-domain-containing protein [Infundibulicybe gibba]|nr:clasp N terminal-domain-containing protein [Infundibulicybe gibba]